MENLKLYINIPIDKKTRIDEIFKELNQKQLDKIYFLIWKINDETKLQINIKNYTTMFGWKHSQTTQVINELIKNVIIVKVGNYKVKEASTSYSLLKPFKITSTDFVLKYNSDFDKLPIWVQRYCTDAGTAKSKKYTSFKKGLKVDRLKELEAENAALKEEILRLKAELENHSSTVKELVENYDEAKDAMIITTNNKDYYFQPYSMLKAKISEKDRMKVVTEILAVKDGNRMLHSGGTSLSYEKTTINDDVLILLTA